MVEDLQAWMAGRTVSAREYSTFMRVWRFGRRHKFAVIAVAAALVLLLVAGSFFTWRLEGQRREARALSGVILKTFIEKLAALPGAEVIIDDVTRPALDYFRAQGALSPAEEVLFGQTLHALGTTSLTVGRIEETRATFDECLSRFDLDSPRADADPEYRAIALGCLIGRIDVADLTGEPGVAGLSMKRVFVAVERWGKRDLESDQWMRAASLALSRMAFVAQNAGDAHQAETLVDQQWQLDLELLRRRPDDAVLLGRHASNALHKSMAVFLPADPAPALDLVQLGLENIRSIPGRLQAPRVMRVWLALLEHQALMLGWLEREAEGERVEKDARVLYEQLLELEPREMRSRAVYADLLLSRHKPCEARRLYDELNAGTQRGENFASWMLAALACGDTATFSELPRAELEQSQDPQVRWLYALWLVTQERADEASDVMKACVADAEPSAVQWPRGVLDAVPQRVRDAGRREAVQTFIREMETFLRDHREGRCPAYSHFSVALERSLK
jgi:tetratricopeptide (TPR) repeat protein